MARILAATDGSDSAGRAIDYAADLAKALNGDLLIVNVAGMLPALLFRRLSSKQNAWIREMESAVQAEILRNAGARARSRGCRKVLLDAGSGDVAKAILKLAQEKNADLIVVGKRGAGRIKGLLIGSVSQKLGSLTPRPIVVVP